MHFPLKMGLHCESRWVKHRFEKKMGTRSIDDTKWKKRKSQEMKWTPPQPGFNSCLNSTCVRIPRLCTCRNLISSGRLRRRGSKKKKKSPASEGWLVVSDKNISGRTPSSSLTYIIQPLNSCLLFFFKKLPFWETFIRHAEISEWTRFEKHVFGARDKKK